MHTAHAVYSTFQGGQGAVHAPTNKPPTNKKMPVAVAPRVTQLLAPIRVGFVDACNVEHTGAQRGWMGIWPWVTRRRIAGLCVRALLRGFPTRRGQRIEGIVAQKRAWKAEGNLLDDLRPRPRRPIKYVAGGVRGDGVRHVGHFRRLFTILFVETREALPERHSGRWQRGAARC
eukprot:864727-Prymnesium_polylepis.1